MSCCVNNCGKPCCDRPAIVRRIKCPNCKRTVEEIWLCSEKTCRCFYQSARRLQSIQICNGTRIPCLYVCLDCARELRAISYGREFVEDGNRGKALRLWKHGDYFEWLWIGFERQAYVIRKRLTIDGRLVPFVRDGPNARILNPGAGAP